MYQRRSKVLQEGVSSLKPPESWAILEMLGGFQDNSMAYVVLEGFQWHFRSVLGGCMGYQRRYWGGVSGSFMSVSGGLRFQEVFKGIPEEFQGSRGLSDSCRGL